ncbi:MAG: hypothetical protein QM647_18470 [Asticcacaulis sp.]|uniref:hypothetical protein n=1 Tax=Asticcacaulis sp. TaxID=1872648 RepID=UPI0039E364E0
MSRTQLIKRMNDGAALYYAMALTAFGQRYRARLFANARIQQFRAFAAACWLPICVLKLLPAPRPYDNELVGQLRALLTTQKDARITSTQLYASVLGYLNMPMPDDDFEFLAGEFERTLKSCEVGEITIGQCASDLASFIEGERDNHEMRVADGPVKRPFYAYRPST